MSHAEDHRALIDLADIYEPQLQAQFERAVRTLRAGVDLDRLTLAIAEGDQERAVRVVLTQSRLDDSMDPFRATIRKTLIPLGGELGAKIFNNQ